MIDLRHPLAVLASRMPWQEIEARVAQVFSRKGRAGVAMPDLYLFGEQVQRAPVNSKAVRPRVPLHVMISLLYLQHALNESNESVEELLTQTINVAVALKLIKPRELTRVIVDSTVQHKAIAHPTDSRLRREIERKASAIGAALLQALGQTLGKARTPYEFGVKVGIASTQQDNLIVGAKAFYGNPYNGHTLNELLQQASTLMQDSAARPTTAFVDLGDRLHALLCAAGYNIRWLLRMIVRKGVAFLQSVLLCLLQASVLGRSWVAAAVAMLSGTAKSWPSARQCPDIQRWPGGQALLHV
jgi:hypothetical protein